MDSWHTVYHTATYRYEDRLREAENARRFLSSPRVAKFSLILKTLMLLFF